ncbi:tyrosine-protein phosphatase non-receptor type 4-like isoform X16 [Branchiostoma floridae]|uniref:Tyrosine-protein phosphatase n=1 Tax=Branchiostoma floridae TaxID=7739 RepID=A0A9J7N319_BRAFL|nr:tyrosine-protein phosphatase non-receptor type 4-like isoform X16 [Branchiostoma floridae]
MYNQAILGQRGQRSLLTEGLWCLFVIIGELLIEQLSLKWTELMGQALQQERKEQGRYTGEASSVSEESEREEGIVMSRRNMFGSSSGTYNVRASEIARDKHRPEVQCQVYMLDDTVQTFKVFKKDKGGVLLDKVFKYLDLVERDYFCLMFQDDIPEQMRWLDAHKPIRKQIRTGSPYSLYFRVKFYATDPSKLQEEYTRYHFFLQLKKDILEGRLPCSPHTASLLASYAAQSELGDYDPSEHLPGYLQEFRFVPNQSPEFEREVEELHKRHVGQPPSEAEFNYLDRAKRLEFYGVDLHYARDQSNLEIQLGVTAAGISIYQNGVKINTFSWAKIVKISFKRKQFFLQLRKEPSDDRENAIGFNLANYRACKNLWKSCVEHHTFFRLDTPKLPSRRNMLTLFKLGSKYRYRGLFRMFKLGSKYRYSGRTERQTIELGKEEGNRNRQFNRNPFFRTPSKRYARRTIGGITRDVIKDEIRNEEIRRSLVHQSQSMSAPGLRNINGSAELLERRPPSMSSPTKEIPIRRAWSDGHQSEEDEGGFSPDYITRGKQFKAYSEDGSFTEKSYEVLPSYNENLPNGNLVADNSIVLIRMKPDEHGRFGFNVKGGADQNMPIIVSRVAPGTPVSNANADKCVPRLNEGDQVLLINGRDVSQHTHEQVVMFIRSTRESHTGELELTVRPNADDCHSGCPEEEEFVNHWLDHVYIPDGVEEEPDFMYTPDNLNPPRPPITSDDALKESMVLVEEGLKTGASLLQFDQLFRKKPGMTCNASRIPENICKNRYRDISPYDETRVTIRSAQDYINANSVNMEIPRMGIVNRYVAAQGPLPNTSGDFWQMCWEQQCTLICMLTTQVERGRVKCHQYWPDLHQTIQFGGLQICCVTEETTPSFAFRDFSMINLNTDEERRVVQMQYLAWPDHGVPDDSTEFLDFVFRVRQQRVGMVEPTLVHCSAGIGRTGVLITMETAMCLIECNEPVYPLDIVRTMREQRAMMIQTPAQYKFVCEAIMRVYKEGIVKPLAEFKSPFNHK